MPDPRKAILLESAHAAAEHLYQAYLILADLQDCGLFPQDIRRARQGAAAEWATLTRLANEAARNA